MAVELKAGTRLRSATCEAEVIVVKAPSGDIDESSDLEILCTKAGTSSLSVGDQVLTLKDAKPLPSSD